MAVASEIKLQKKPINNVKLPFVLLIIAAALVVIAQIARPQIDSQPSEWKVTYVLLTGLPFILEFIAIVLTFVFSIFAVAKWLNNRISPRAYNLIEAFILVCVLFGVVGMFQPWDIQGYNIGFHVLLFAMLAFNVWSHVSPRKPPRAQQDATPHA
jgi:hypothetical protein